MTSDSNIMKLTTLIIIPNTVNQQILAAIEFGVSQNKSDLAVFICKFVSLLTTCITPDFLPMMDNYTGKCANFLVSGH